MEHEMSMDGLVHDAERLKELQALPLSRKILITQARIIEFVERMGGPDNVFVSLSGKDSTVLLHIARQIYPTIKAVFADTGLEFPENRRSAVMYGAELVRPKMKFTDVLTDYGYPLIGKEVAECIYYARRIRPTKCCENVNGGDKRCSGNGNNSKGDGRTMDEEFRGGVHREMLFGRYSITGKRNTKE